MQERISNTEYVLYTPSTGYDYVWAICLATQDFSVTDYMDKWPMEINYPSTSEISAFDSFIKSLNLKPNKRRAMENYLLPLLLHSPYLVDIIVNYYSIPCKDLVHKFYLLCSAGYI